jgi:hypothetical protein
VTFRKHEYARGSMRLKLVKSSGNNVEPAPFSDSIHDVLEVFGTRDPYTVDVPQEVAEVHRTFTESLHVHLGVAYFIYN